MPASRSISWRSAQNVRPSSLTQCGSAQHMQASRSISWRTAQHMLAYHSISCPHYDYTKRTKPTKRKNFTQLCQARFSNSSWAPPSKEKESPRPGTALEEQANVTEQFVFFLSPTPPEHCPRRKRHVAMQNLAFGLQPSSPKEKESPMQWNTN